jgi:hypothetical protein
MAKRIINGVLDNFLGTFTSRYSNYSGYWVFGMMVEETRKGDAVRPNNAPFFQP